MICTYCGGTNVTPNEDDPEFGDCPDCAGSVDLGEEGVIAELERRSQRIEVLERALLELALAAEAFDWGDTSQPRMRAAVNAAYVLVDADGSAQRAALRAGGCTKCGAAFTDADPNDAELCRACACEIPCLKCGEKGECSCFT